MTIPQANKATDKAFRSAGVEKLNEPYHGYTHVLETKIGKLYIKPDHEGSVSSIYGNFYDNPNEAKELVGHWKYNLHVMKKGTDAEEFEQLITDHFKKVTP